MMGQGGQQGALSPWQQAAVIKGEWLMKTHLLLTRLKTPSQSRQVLEEAQAEAQRSPSALSPFDKEERQALFPGTGLRGITPPPSIS